MTQLQILNLAYAGALNIRESWRKKVKYDSTNPYYRENEKKASEDLATITKLIYDEKQALANKAAKEKEKTKIKDLIAQKILFDHITEAIEIAEKNDISAKEFGKIVAEYGNK